MNLKKNSSRGERFAIFFVSENILFGVKKKFFFALLKFTRFPIGKFYPQWRRNSEDGIFPGKPRRESLLLTLRLG